MTPLRAVTPGRFTLAVLLAALFAAPAPPAPAADDAARARAGVQEGRYVPLATILDWIEARWYGRAIEIELEEEDGRPVYEVEWLTPQGKVVELEFDARTGELLEREGRGLEEAAR
ncbi:MAG TPA: PepSY domain-containing protein [Myxococcota bacterium]